MAFSKIFIFTLFMVATFEASMAAVYTVGDSKGWRKLGHNFYQDWASSKDFQIGDVLAFKYNPDEHNVLQVSIPDFESCTASSPLSITYTSGNDNINISGPGTYSYICGIPGHCEVGMKFQVVVGESSETSGSPNQTGTFCPPGGQNPGQDPYYGRSDSSTLSCNWLIASVLGLPTVVAFSYIFGFWF